MTKLDTYWGCGKHNALGNTDSGCLGCRKEEQEAYHKGKHDGLEKGLAFKPEVIIKIQQEARKATISKLKRKIVNNPKSYRKEAAGSFLHNYALWILSTLEKEKDR